MTDWRFAVYVDSPPAGSYAVGVMAMWTDQKRTIEVVLGSVAIRIGWFRL